MNYTATADWHQTAPTELIEVNGIRYAYRTFGNNSDIPLILLQHFTGTMDNWDPAVTNGLARFFQVVLFDYKGMGASEGETPDTIEAMACDVIQLIKALGFTKVNLLGFSMGGFIAQQITLYEPALINKIILAGTGPKDSQGLANIVKCLTCMTSKSLDEQRLFMFYKPTPVSLTLGRQSLARTRQRTVNRDPDADMTAIQAQLNAILNWAQPDVTALELLKQIRQPVLVVNGSNDILVPTINSYVLYQNLPNARLSLYPDSGHGAIFQYPDLFVAEAVPFLEEEW